MTMRKHLDARRVLYLLGIVELILMLSVGSLGAYDQYRRHGWTWTETVIVDGLESTQTMNLSTTIFSLAFFSELLLIILVAYSDLPEPRNEPPHDRQEKALEP